MQVIPAIDLLGTDAVRLERGDFDRVLFRQDLEEFLARVVATHPPLVHVVDLQGARDGQLRREILERCVTGAGGVPVQYSGGLRSVADARAALDAGATRVIVGTSLWRDESALANFVAELDVRLVAALDVRDGRIAVRGWSDSAGLSFADALSRCVAAGVTRIHVTAIDRDGTLAGPDLSLYERAVTSGLAVVAAGGVRDDRDVAQLERVGCEAAIMGVGYLPRLGLSLDELRATS